LCDGAIRYAIPCEFLNTFIPFGVFPLVRPQMGECVEEFTSSYLPAGRQALRSKPRLIVAQGDSPS